MTYNFIRIRTKETKTVDKHNCIRSLVEGFTVTPIETFNAESDSDAIELIAKEYQAVLNGYELEEDYLEWMKKDVSENGTIFVTLYAIIEEGETIDWRYNG